MGLRESKQLKPLKPSLYIENLVFEGGGVRGIAHIGALERLNELNLLTNVKKYAGTSAGSIVATLLAIGYNIEELKTILLELDFEALLDDKIGVLRDAYAIMSVYGYCKGEVFADIMKTHITMKTGTEDYTFKQLWNDKGIELVLVGTNLSRKQEVRFSYKTTPDMTLLQATHISMSIPLIFKPTKIGNDYYVDGGVINNYPLTVFDENCVCNHKTIGIKLETTDEDKDKDIDNIILYIQRIVDTLSLSSTLDEDYKKRTVIVDTGNISSLDFDITTKQKMFLIQQGRNAIEKFIK